MSKDDEKEQGQEPGFKVQDKRRFAMEQDGRVVSRAGADEETPAKEEKSPEAGPSEAEPKTETKPPSGSECEERLKNLPPMTFSTLILSLSTQAMISLGQVPDPMTNETGRNLPLAKQTIDLLGILEEKTKGNLSKEEELFLKQSLTDLRLLFVHSCKG